ncbi:MAG: terminase family protein, partial [Pseudomonadota bacterium]
MSNCAALWSLWWEKPSLVAADLEWAELEILRRFPFLRLARRAQRPPRGDWRTWLFVGGRGAGKTRAGAEWTRYAILCGDCRRIALVGPTLGDVREVMIEGPSGLRQIEPAARQRPTYNRSRRRLEWPNGAVGLVFSAEDPDSLRGPQFDAAWCDEIGVWARGEAVWNNLQFGLRLGAAPRCVATTTPRPVPLVKRLMRGEAVLTHSATRDNAEHLAPGFVDSIEAAYAGTALARQELFGELLEDLDGALWRRSDLDRNRVATPPDRF